MQRFLNRRGGPARGCARGGRRAAARDRRPGPRDARGGVLAMQRGAGNQAVTAMLQRQRARRRPRSPGPGDFGVSGGEPQVRGKVTAKPDGDGVRAESPDVKYPPAKVWLGEGKNSGGSRTSGSCRTSSPPRAERCTAAAGIRPATSRPSRARVTGRPMTPSVTQRRHEDQQAGVPAVLLAAQQDERRERGRQPGRDRARRRTTSRGSRSRPRWTTGA